MLTVIYYLIKKMKACKYINTTIIFSEDRITPCYSSYMNQAPFYALIKDCLAEDINFESKHNEFIQELNSSCIENYPCKNCCHLTDFDIFSNKYNSIIIKLWNNKPLKYDIYKIISDLYDKNLIDKEFLIVEFQCGDIRISSIYKNLIELFKQKGCKKFKIFTNNLMYDSVVEELLKSNKCEIFVSYNNDSIKSKEQKHSILKVFRHYIKSTENKDAIKAYYNLSYCRNLKDKDIEQFVKLMYSTGINCLSLRLDYELISKWINSSVPLKDCSKNLHRNILYFFKLCRYYSFYSDMNYEEQNIVLKKIFKTNKKISLFKKFIKLFRKKNEI